MLNLQGIMLSRESGQGWKTSAQFIDPTTGETKIATLNIDTESSIALSILEKNFTEAIIKAITPEHV